MNARISRLGIGLVVCFALLFIQLNRVQVFGAERLNDNPENLRAIDRSYEQRRGIIASADGAVIARTLDTPGQRFERIREYPEKDLFAHVSGYYSFEFGAEGAERAFNDELAGLTNEQRFESWSDLFVDRDRTADVTLTVRKDVQEAARAALGERKGSVVVVDPRSGAVLAMWSYPSYDPNLLSGQDIEAIRAAWAQLAPESPDSPMLPRAYRERFAPGSTFKIVTAGVGVDSGGVTATQPVYPVSRGYVPPANTNPIQNFEGSSCGGALIQIITVSCNTAFAQMGAETNGPDKMITGAAKFGFNTAPPFDLPVPAVSIFPTDYGAKISEGVYEDSARLAQASIGQNDVAATPLTMALVAAAMANDGAMMKPHVLGRVTARDGEVLQEPGPELWQQSVSPASAALVRQGMESVVAKGTATLAAIPGKVVGAKTGTAEVGQGEATNAWIIGYAGEPGQPASVAFSVIVEADPGIGEQTGGRIAAPIAKAVVEAALTPLQPITGG
jgi:peptidoglycan glycosyltransferase